MDTIEISQDLTLTTRSDPQAVVLCGCQKLHRMEIRVRPRRSKDNTPQLS